MALIYIASVLLAIGLAIWGKCTSHRNFNMCYTRDIALAGGSLDALITKLIEQVRSGNMEQREVGAMFIHSLTDQPRGLAGEQEAWA